MLLTLSSKINNTARARMSFKTAKGGGWKKAPGLNQKAATSEAKGGFLRGGQLYHDLWYFQISNPEYEQKQQWYS